MNHGLLGITRGRGAPVGHGDLPASPLLREQYALIREAQPSATDGGGSSAGSWVTRTLNRVAYNPNRIVSLVNNQMSFLPGLYRICGMSHTETPQNTQVRVYDVTAAATALAGLSVYGGWGEPAVVEGLFNAVGGHVYELQQRVTNGVATLGLGVASSFGEEEYYSNVELWRLQ